MDALTPDTTDPVNRPERYMAIATAVFGLICTIFGIWLLCADPILSSSKIANATAMLHVPPLCLNNAFSAGQIMDRAAPRYIPWAIFLWGGAGGISHRRHWIGKTCIWVWSLGILVLALIGAFNVFYDA